MTIKVIAQLREMNQSTDQPVVNVISTERSEWRDLRPLDFARGDSGVLDVTGGALEVTGGNPSGHSETRGIL